MVKLILGLSLMLGLAGLGGWFLSTIPSVAASTAQTIAIPSYFYPDGEDGLWAQMEAASPIVGLAIINPFNGPGPTKDEDYVNQAASSQAAGIIVLGYVYTSYGSRSTEEVKSEIDDYYRWYGVDGIFLDEVTTGCATQPYYAELNDYIKLNGAGEVTALNPGTRTSECYMSVSDILLTFEDPYRVYKRIAWPPGWEAGYPASRFWHLVHKTRTPDDMKDAVLLSKGRNAGWVYVTPDQGGNPWDTLPSDPYWSEELAAASGGPADGPPPDDPPPETQSLTVTISLDRDPPNYTNGEVVAIKAHVTDDASPPSSVGGAAVYFKFTTAKGGLLECNILTNSSGEAICTYRVKSKRDGVGEYTVAAVASKTGFKSGSGSTTFQVTD